MIYLYGLFVFLSMMLFVFVANQQFIKTNYYQNTVRQVKKFVDGVPDELELVSTGSSYGRYGFDFEASNIKSFNFALQPQSLSYDFKILKQYQSYLKNDCKVIITIVPLVFGFLDYQNDNRNTEYYYFLDKKHINGYTKFKYFTRIKFPILSAKLRLWHLIKDQPVIDLHTIDASKSYQETEIEAKKRVEGWCKQFNLADMSSSKSVSHLGKMFDQTTTLLSEMIEFCIKNDFDPIIVIPPVSGILNNMISKEFMEEMLYKNIRRANKRNIPVLDYLYDERFQDYRLYVNSDFLNIEGRKLFTNVVLKDLKLEK